jgi:hypothetical protein
MNTFSAIFALIYLVFADGVDDEARMRDLA